MFHPEFKLRLGESRDPLSLTSRQSLASPSFRASRPSRFRAQHSPTFLRPSSSSTPRKRGPYVYLRFDALLRNLRRLLSFFPSDPTSCYPFPRDKRNPYRSVVTAVSRGLYISDALCERQINAFTAYTPNSAGILRRHVLHNIFRKVHDTGAVRIHYRKFFFELRLRDSPSAPAPVFTTVGK
jgi:hypothetical protein